MENMTQDDGVGLCRARDDVNYYMISGGNFKQFDFIKLVFIISK